MILKKITIYGVIFLIVASLYEFWISFPEEGKILMSIVIGSGIYICLRFYIIPKLSKFVKKIINYERFI